MQQKIAPDIIRLNDIISAIADIEQFSKDSFNDRKTIMAVAYGVAIIGEAAANLTGEFCGRHAHIPWSAIVGMRHRIIHGYGKVSVDRLREVVDTHLPKLKSDIQAILQSLQ